MTISEGGLPAQLQAQTDNLRARRGAANAVPRPEARTGAAAFERVAADARTAQTTPDTERPRALERDRSPTVVRDRPGQPRPQDTPPRSSEEDVAEAEQRVAALNRREAPFGGSIRQAAGQAGVRLGQIVDLTV